MRRTFLILISVIFSMMIAIPRAEAKHGQKHGKGSPQQVVIFAPEERRIIHEYFRTNTSNLPPGLAKRHGNLPPGLQKHIRRNGQLPPGLEKRVDPFPSDLERRLPGLPPIYRRGIIGDNAVIYDPNTNAILDVIQIIAGTRR